MNIKIGMNLLLWAVEITPKHLPLIEMLKNTGFDGVEIPLVDGKLQQLGLLANACDDIGLERTASMFMTPEANPISSDVRVRSAALDHLKQRVDDAYSLGANMLVGGIYQAHKYFSGAAPTQAEWQWSRDFLRAGGDYAKSAGVHLGLEFLNRFEAYLINTSAEAKRMIDDVDLPNVGVLYDTHHSNLEDPTPTLALESIKSSVNHIHLSESHRGTLGSGQVNFGETFLALHKMEYKGWLVIEAFGMTNPDIIPAANIWRNAFESEEQLCRDGLEFIKQNLSRGSA